MALDGPTDISHVLNKRQFEAVVQYVLDKGEIWENYSQLWGSSPYLRFDDFYITLSPNTTNHADVIKYMSKKHYDVSDFVGFTVGHFDGLASASIVLQENGIYVVRIVNGSSEYDVLLNKLIKTVIPTVKKTVKIR